MAATHATRGSEGWRRMRLTRSVFSRPRRCQVFPPSSVLKTPSPTETLLRGLLSPVPTQTTSELLGSMARAPIDATGWSSKTGSQVRPPLTDFQTPPLAEPIQTRFGSLAHPSTTAIRPLIAAGPIARAFIPASRDGSTAARAGPARSARPRTRPSFSFMRDTSTSRTDGTEPTGAETVRATFPRGRRMEDEESARRRNRVSWHSVPQSVHRTSNDEEASMIRKNLAGLMIVMVGLVSTAVWAQTADELIEKNIQAKGGREKIKAIKTLRMTGKMGLGQGIEAPVTLEMARPDKMRLEFVVQGMTGIQTYDGKEGWMLMPFMGKTDPEPIAGKEDLEGTPAYKLKITKKNGDTGYYWLDADSFLVFKASGKTTVNGQEIEGETYFGDYKESGGVMFAHSVENKAVGQPGTMTITIDKIEVNPDLPAEHFGKPEAAKPAAAKP